MSSPSESAIEPLIEQLNQVNDGRPDLDTSLKLVLGHFECATGSIHRVGNDGELELVAHAGIPDTLLPIIARIPLGKGIAGVTAERREPTQICNLQTDQSGVAKERAKETGMEGCLCVPILDGDRLLGTFGIAKPFTYDYDDGETRELERIVDWFVARGLIGTSS